MPEKNNPYAQRLYDSLIKHVGIQSAERIKNLSLSQTASDKKKFEWAEDICTTLEKEFDKNTIKSIRMDCACGPSIGHMEEMKKLYNSTESLVEFAKHINEASMGAASWCEGQELFFSYPTCYCSCVKRIDKPLSKTWCYCTLGYTKRMFDYVLGYDTDVELIESIKTGGSSCIIKISKDKNEVANDEE
ncbi:MAG: DUF6144 family protein [Clostridiaceae bacterium]